MASWKSLDTELPLALKEHVAFVAKRVWRDVGNKVVLQLDHWHHLARASYIPPLPRGTTPQALIVNCVEGEKDRPAQNTVYTVDVFRRRVKIKDGTDRDYAPVPADCADALNALEAWVREMPAREEAARQEAAARRQAVLQAQEEASRKRKRETDEAMEDYTDRLRHFLALAPPDDIIYLAQEGVDIEELITDPQVRGRCPFCKHKLGSCRKCKVLSCHLKRSAWGRATIGSRSVSNTRMRSTALSAGATRTIPTVNPGRRAGMSDPSSRVSSARAPTARPR
jgi:hypothetical protein